MARTLIQELSKFCKITYGRKCHVEDKTILINADALDSVATLAKEFGQFANCWINDPPYGTTLNDWDKVIPADDYWDMVELATTLKAPIIVFGSQPFTSSVVMSAVNWHRYCLVWNKNKCGSPGLAKYRPMKVHEDIAVFSRKTHSYYPQLEEGEPYTRLQVQNDTKRSLNNHKYGLQPKDIVNKGTRYPKSILNFGRNFSPQQQLHPTQKPTNLLDWLLRSYTVETDVVIDITAGSSSLGIAAYDIDQPCLCIEKDPKYFKIGKDWLSSKAKGQTWDPASYRRNFLGA